MRTAVVGVVLVLGILGYMVLGDVASEENILDSIAHVSQMCEGDVPNRFECYDLEVAALSKKYSTRAVLEAIALDNSRQLVKDCHIFTHAIGHQVYKESDSFLSAFSGCSEYCFSGCYHGIAEEHFSQLFIDGAPVTADTFSELTTFFKQCAAAEENELCWKEFGDALHGVGHALMFVSGNDVIEALEQCDHVSPQGTPRACYDGVFMSNNENFFEQGSDTLFAKLDDPLFPCTTLEKTYQPTCYKSVAEYRLSGTPDENLALCARFPSSEQQYCFEQVVRADTVNISDASALARVCNDLGANFQEFCVRGTARYLTDKYDAEQSTLFCDALKPGLKEFCAQ